jgi:predicted kinase
MKLIMTKGLPASGKSTWAKEQKIARVNKDDLRNMVHDGKWSKKNEKLILAYRNALIKTTLSKGESIIVDDTNLHPKHEQDLERMAKELGADFEIKDFTSISLEECLERDKKRPGYVGEKVIKRMYDQFLTPKTPEYEYNHKLETCIIVDVDGTLAVKGNRSPYDWKRVGEDTVFIPIATIVNRMSKMFEVIIFSGRDGSCYKETKQWLDDNNIPYNGLFLRAEGDSRKDSIVKKELYENHVKGKYNVHFVLDDRDQVVDMWRKELGLPCLQVNYGDF